MYQHLPGLAMVSGVALLAMLPSRLVEGGPLGWVALVLLRGGQVLLALWMLVVLTVVVLNLVSRSVSRAPGGPS